MVPDDFDARFQRGFGLLAFSVNRHIVDHMRRINLELGMDLEMAQIWGTLAATEQTLAAQFSRFAGDFTRVPAPQAQISKLPFALPYAQPLLPGRWLFDARRLFELHARAIDALARNTAGLPHKERAYRMTAELYLMQHSCHWFCRSKNLASARLLARHRSSYAQVLAAVAPETRRDYEALVR